MNSGGPGMVESHTPALYTLACSRPVAQSNWTSGPLVNARRYCVHQYLVRLPHAYPHIWDSMNEAYERVLDALSARQFKIKPNGNQRCRAQCPAHNGTDLNLAVAAGDQGVLVKCHSHDCTPRDIAESLGMTLDDLFDDHHGATYDMGGGWTVTRKRVNAGEKKIFQTNPRTKGAIPLYVPSWGQSIENAEIVAIVEGEKCADVAIRMGLPCAVSWPMGAHRADAVDLSPLAGKRVRLIADNDEPGRKAMQTIYNRLLGFATVESVMTAPNEGEGIDDVWVNGGTLSDLIPLKLHYDGEPEEPEPDRKYSLRDLTKVKTRKPRFLWEPVLPYGSLVLFAGKGGCGKSTFALWLAGLVTTGRLKGHLHGVPGNVLYVSHEDSVEEIVVPRLIANEVDLNRFRILDIHAKGRPGATIPRLPEDMALIRQAVIDFDAKLVIIDPITSTLGGDNDKLADVRAMLDPLNQLGQELGVGVIAIAHFKKGGGAQSDMVSGSHAYRDASRAVLLFAKEDHMDENAEDNPPTIITLDKSNVSASGQSYSFRSDPVEIDLDDGETGTTTKVTWMGPTTQSVGSIINREPGSRQGSLANEIKAFIDAQPGAVDGKTIVAEFSDEKPGTVYANLKRLKARGLIDSPAWGVYQSMKYATTKER